MSPLEEWMSFESPQIGPRLLNRARESVLGFLGISLILHLLVLAGLWFFNPKMNDSYSKSSINRPPVAIQTRFISESELNSQILGVQPKDSDIVENPKDRAKYLSDKTRRFEKQQILKNSGLLDAGVFKNKIQEGESKEQAKKTGASGELTSGRLFFPSEQKEQNVVASDSATGQNPNIPRGVSEHLEDQDIAVGGEVLLSTDEYKYASFYQRLSRDLYPIWYGRIESRVDRKELRRQDTAHTRILVFVDNEGEIQRLEPVINSGCKSCDQIAAESLLNLGQMKNPPRDRLGPDGLYNFYVNFLITTRGQASWVRFSPDAEPPKFYNPSPAQGQAR